MVLVWSGWILTVSEKFCVDVVRMTAASETRRPRKDRREHTKKSSIFSPLAKQSAVILEPVHQRAFPPHADPAATTAASALVTGFLGHGTVVSVFFHSKSQPVLEHFGLHSVAGYPNISTVYSFLIR